ncbi:MAG: PAS domain-containing protein, partial [Myxococcales bacterium]|nr:PAS domain-containing protein [Myxococcales bacterium]
SKDGAFRWFTTGCVPIRDEKGHIVRWYGSATDIDDVKQATRAQEQGAAAMALVLDLVDEAFLVLDEKLLVVHVSAAAARRLRRPREELVNRGLFDLWPAMAGTAVEERLRTHGVVEAEPRWMGLDGDGHGGDRAIRLFAPHAAALSVLRTSGQSAREPTANHGRHGEAADD